MRMAILLGAAIGIAAIVGFVVQQTPEQPTTAAMPTPEAHPNSAPPAAPSDSDGSSISGAVRETIDVAQYTYLRLATASGETWAAVSKTPVATGSNVTVTSATRMQNFKSSTLNRTFDVIYFGNLQGEQTALPAGHPDVSNQNPALPAGHPDISGNGVASPHGATPASGTEVKGLSEAKVERATGPNAHTISELFAQSKTLEGKTVRVRGQVSKVTTGIQGKNYLRVRDGSSKDPNQTELVLTSQVEPKLGDVVTFEGTLRTNVDVGIGYNYAVLIENARVVQ